MRHTFFLFISLFLLIKSTFGQNSLNTVKKYSINDCVSPSQYFDISRLECKNCPPNSRSFDRLNCKCDQNYYFSFNNGGGSISCQPCQNGYVQSLDGFSCVLCNNNCNQCSGGYRTDLDIYGNQLASSECIICDKENSILSGNSCKSCKPFIYLDSNSFDLETIKCNSSLNLIGGLYFLNSTIADEPNNFNIEFGNENLESWFLKEYSKSVFRTCKNANRRNITSCQILSNMCVLSLYKSVQNLNPIQTTVDVCKAYDEIKSSDNVTNSALPWIKYDETLDQYKKNYLTGGINSKFIQLKYSSSCNNNKFNFVSAEYNLEGKLVRFEKLDISRLQLCLIDSNYAKTSDRSPFSTTKLVQKCSISLSNLFEIADSKSAIFFDLFLELENETNIFPIPVKILNLNRGENKMQRRFFLYETISSKVNQNSNSTYIRYAKSITINFELIKGKSKGEIYPPLFLIEYDFAKRDDIDKKVEISFNIDYNMEIDLFNLIMYISLGFFGFFAFLWTCLKSWNWNRRSGRIAIDIITLFKFILFLIGSVANCFLVVIAIGSLYWLIFYRSQYYVNVFLPNESQENTFRLFLLIGFILKLLDVFYMILLQSSYDIFFIDWEKPKTQLKVLPPITGNKNNQDDQVNHQDKVSCWRSLFVANEWNELQTFRKTNITIQLVLVLLLLKVFNLEALALRDCSTNIFRQSNEYQPPYSSILRLAIGSSIFLAIGLLQFLFYTCLYSRCIQDKIGEFVDFCSVSNISMFIMTHSQFGYYIHGRSPHGTADTNMYNMTKALLKEENDFIAKRGLDLGSNHQTFSISVQARLTRQYSKIMTPLFQKKRNKGTIRRDEATSSKEFETKMTAYSSLNKFLMAFIDNILRNMNYTIVKRNLFENILDIEFKVPRENGYFYEDDMACFTETIFFGKERTLFAFDLLLFLFVDYWFQNYILAALILYIVTKIFKIIRSDMGKRNLSKKTMVDKRFLI